MLTVCKVYSSEKNRQMSLPSGSLKHIVFVCNAFLTNKNCVICRTDPVPIISPSVLFLIGPYCYGYGRSNLLTVAQPYSTMCIHHALIIYSPSGGHLSCFQLTTTKNILGCSRGSWVYNPSFLWLYKCRSRIVILGQCHSYFNVPRDAVKDRLQSLE